MEDNEKKTNINPFPSESSNLSEKSLRTQNKNNTKQI